MNVDKTPADNFMLEQYHDIVSFTRAMESWPIALFLLVVTQYR